MPDRIWDADPELHAAAEVERDRHQAAGLEIADARPPEFSDEALALRFSAKYADSARYVAAWNRWLLWDGSRWEFDATMRAFDLARGVCRVASAEIADPKQVKLAAAVASARTVAATIGLARADRRHAATVEQWDADPRTFATKGTTAVTVDLLTGQSRMPRREDYATKRAGAEPGGDCPRWRQFLDEITNRDADLQVYLQRMAGYCLTGITIEHVMFFCHGTGANGKSVFINTLAGIWGDYATTAPMETFVASRNEQHPTDLAGLRGARLVIAQETEQGRRWAESKIKSLTGGDRVAARFMRQDFFEFTPQFKLLISGNHKPGLRGVDEAIRRRLHLIPFVVTIPEAQRDPRLSDKLKTEWGGILSWAIDGCLDWQRAGLAPPGAVRDATDAYLVGEDALAQWLDERCARDGIYTERSAMLFANWKEWAEAVGEFVGSQKRFSQALEDRGFIRVREGGTGSRMFRGLALRLSEGFL